MPGARGILRFATIDLVKVRVPKSSDVKPKWAAEASKVGLEWIEPESQGNRTFGTRTIIVRPHKVDGVCHWPGEFIVGGGSISCTVTGCDAVATVPPWVLFRASESKCECE